MSDLTQEELEALADLDIFPVRCGTCGVRVYGVDGPCNRCYHLVSKPLWVPMGDPEEDARVVAYWRARMMEDESSSE